MNLLNEIITVILLLIVINIIFFMISNSINRKLNKIDKDSKNEKKGDNNDYSKRSDLETRLNKIKNVFILIFGIVGFATLLDLYNIIIENTNSYIHILGIINFAKVNSAYLNSMFIYSIGQLVLYINVLLLLLIRGSRKRIIITIACILIYILGCCYRLYSPYVFYKEAKQYEYLNNYDLIADFEEDDQVSEEGALKILKDEFKCDYIGNVTAELVNIENIEDITIKYSCDFEEFWIVTFDYMTNFEIKEDVCAFVDLYTGQVSYLTY